MCTDCHCLAASPAGCGDCPNSSCPCSPAFTRADPRDLLPDLALLLDAALRAGHDAAAYAERIAGRLGISPYGGPAAAEAALREALGHRTARSPEDTSLSARELQVARLAAAGLTDRQIASHLTLSVRTVNAHVCHVLRKAGVPNRASLAHWLAGHAPVTAGGH